MDEGRYKPGDRVWYWPSLLPRSGPGAMEHAQAATVHHENVVGQLWVVPDRGRQPVYVFPGDLRPMGEKEADGA